MLKTRLFIPLALILLLTEFAYPQRSNVWLNNNDRGNRHEGVYSKKISNPSINLVSLVGIKEAYQFGKKQSLKISFYSPKSEKYLLSAEELMINKFYWMQDKNTTGNTGWNSFDKWPVDYLLKRLSISHRNLGILIRYGSESSRSFLPAFVYINQKQKPDLRSKYYVAHFQLGRSINSGNYSLYEGEFRKQSQKLKSLPISRKPGGIAFPVIIKTSWLEKNGWYTVVVNLRERNSGKIITYTFKFYHYKND